MRRALHIFLIAGLLILPGGCFWKYSPRPGTIPPHIESVAISETGNNTAEFNLGQEFTAMLTDQMQLENLLPLSAPAAAHSIIYTDINSINDAVYSYDESEIVKEYRLSMKMDFRWYDAVNEKDIMNKPLSDYEIYYSDQYNNSLPAADRVTRDEALDRLLDKMAESVMVELTSQW